MRVLLPLVAALALAGCMEPIDFVKPMAAAGLDWGSIAIESFKVEPQPAPLGQVAARVVVVVRVANADAPRLDVMLDDERCSAFGPPAAPSTPAASARRGLPERTNATWTFDEALRGDAQPGLDASVFVAVEAENAVGPIFGECKEFRRPLPRAP